MNDSSSIKLKSLDILFQLIQHTSFSLSDRSMTIFTNGSYGVIIDNNGLMIRYTEQPQPMIDYTRNKDTYLLKIIGVDII